MPHVTVHECEGCKSRLVLAYEQESPEHAKKQLKARQEFHHKQSPECRQHKYVEVKAGAQTSAPALETLSYAEAAPAEEKMSKKSRA